MRRRRCRVEAAAIKQPGGRCIRGHERGVGHRQRPRSRRPRRGLARSRPRASEALGPGKPRGRPRALRLSHGSGLVTTAGRRRRIAPRPAADDANVDGVDEQSRSSANDGDETRRRGRIRRRPPTGWSCCSRSTQRRSGRPHQRCQGSSQLVPTRTAARQQRDEPYQRDQRASGACPGIAISSTRTARTTSQTIMTLSSRYDGRRTPRAAVRRRSREDN